MVVGRRERHCLADAQVGQGVGVGCLEPRREPERTDAHDQTLSGHEPRDGLHGAEGARVGEGHGRARQVVGGDAVAVHLAHQVLVGAHEAAEVERVSVADARHEEGAGAVRPLDVDGQPEADVVMTDDSGRPLAVHVGHERSVHGRDGTERLDHGEADQVSEADLGPGRAEQLVVDDGPIDLEQLGRHHPDARGRRDPERRLHVGHDPRRRPAERCGDVGVFGQVRLGQLGRLGRLGRLGWPGRLGWLSRGCHCCRCRRPGRWRRIQRCRGAGRGWGMAIDGSWHRRIGRLPSGGRDRGNRARARRTVGVTSGRQEVGTRSGADGCSGRGSGRHRRRRRGCGRRTRRRGRRSR